jgi:hypothetical protein
MTNSTKQILSIISNFITFDKMKMTNNSIIIKSLPFDSFKDATKQLHIVVVITTEKIEVFVQRVRGREFKMASLRFDTPFTINCYSLDWINAKQSKGKPFEYSRIGVYVLYAVLTGQLGLNDVFASYGRKTTDFKVHMTNLAKVGIDGMKPIDLTYGPHPLTKTVLFKTTVNSYVSLFDYDKDILG